jgi:hypothetical protein
VNEPAESVELDGLVFIAGVPVQVAIPIVGILVWLDLKWALLSVRLAKVVVVPPMVIVELVVLTRNRDVPALFWIWKALAESEAFLKVLVAPVQVWVAFSRPMLAASDKAAEVIWTPLIWYWPPDPMDRLPAVVTWNRVVEPPVGLELGYR